MTDLILMVVLGSVQMFQLITILVIDVWLEAGWWLLVTRHRIHKQCRVITGRIDE